MKSMKRIVAGAHVFHLFVLSEQTSNISEKKRIIFFLKLEHMRQIYLISKTSRKLSRKKGNDSNGGKALQIFIILMCTHFWCSSFLLIFLLFLLAEWVRTLRGFYIAISLLLVLQ